MNTEPPTQEQCICECGDSRPTVNCDQEAWIKARIRTAINMAVAVGNERNVCAEQGMMDHAIDGVINGAAIEIIQTLGMLPCYENLYRREEPKRRSDRTIIHRPLNGIGISGESIPAEA